MVFRTQVLLCCYEKEKKRERETTRKREGGREQARWAREGEGCEQHFSFARVRVVSRSVDLHDVDLSLLQYRWRLQCPASHEPDELP